MPRYLVERTFSAPARAGTADDGHVEDRCDDVIRANAREGVTWIHSFVTPDRCRSFCIVDSPSPEAIRVAAQATTLPVDRITEVRVFDPYSL
jgi:hypothetical protein